MAIKITKKEILETIGNFFENYEGEIAGDVTKEAIINYVTTTIGQLDAKAVKAKERAEKVKAEGDEIRAAIEAVLTNEFKTTADIIAEVGIEDLSPGKVAARMSQLIKASKATKTDVKVGDKKVKAYGLPTATLDEAEEEPVE